MASSDPPEGTVPVAGALSALLEDLAREPVDAVSASPAPAAGARVGDRFEVVRELGRGGFGAVVEARDQVLKRPVALKFFRPGRRLEAPDAKVLAEADAVARLSHPNIVQIHDRGTSDAGPFLVLELLEGEPLSRRIQRGTLGVAEAARLVLGVARGLAHAHLRGVIHRDLKPGNAFLCADGQVKILDFGLAHLVGHDPTFGGGTPGWMAPEQRRGEPGDERTDVWALGAILFRALAGKDPSSAGLTIPGAADLEALVEAMLAPDSASRPRDASRVVEALEPIVHRLESGIPHVPTGGAEGAGVAALRLREPTTAPATSTSRRALAVAALAVLLGAAGVGGYLWRARLAPAPSAKPGPASIAVLSFSDMSPGHDQEYLADGLAEEVLNGLAQVDGLRVVGRSTSFSYKGKGRKVEEIGRELGVGAVLEGSVRRSGDRVRITAQLVHTSDASAIWSQSFDRGISDVFALQDEIGRAVVEALAVRLLPGRSSARAGGSTDPEALQLFLRGRDLLRRGAPESPKACESFEMAVAADPRFALAWVGIADSIVTIEATMGHLAGDPAARRRRAREAADRAVALAPDLPDAFRARADVHQWLESDWRGQRADLERALALAPGDPGVALSHGFALQARGDLDAAIAEFSRATRIDPLLDTGWLNGWLGLGVAQISRGDHAAGAASLRRALELFPTYCEPHWGLGMSFIAAGQPEEALAEAGRSGRACPYQGYALGLEALAHHDLGHPAEARAALDEVVRNFGDKGAEYQVAELHAWRGEADRAFAWLEKARAKHDTAMFWLKTDPLLRKIRGDPRWAELLRKADLPPDGPSPGAAVPRPATASIAVLPFADMSPKHDQEYFADGVTEEILNALSHVDGLKVIGRTSSFSFKGKPDDLRSIGEKLGVTSVLEGSLRKDGGRIRITAKLARAVDGVQLWSETYERKLVGVFQIQDEIAGAVSTALQVRLLPAARSAPRSHDPDAYTSYLQGRQILSRMTSEELPLAVASFEKAVAVEPTFAEAWAGLSLALDERSGDQSSLEGILGDKREALDAANRAVELAPRAGAGFAARAQLVDIRGWDWQGSIADARRAVELDPGDVQARVVLGDLLSASGNGEAVQQLRLATELDPLSTLAWNKLSLAAGLAGDPALRAAAHARAREINPRNDWRTIEGQRSKEWAEAVLREPVGNRTLMLTDRVLALRVLGREAEARAALDELIACCSFSGAWQIAILYEEDAHQRDKAFEWLERARVNMDGGIRNLKLADRFKGDPRTAEILRRMNLPVD